MNANELIIEVLAPVNIPIFPDVCDNKTDEYLVFNYADEHYDNYSDNMPENSYTQFQLHYFVRGKSPLNNRKKICRLLLNAGFDVSPGPIYYEEDTKYRHATISIGIDSCCKLEGE